MGEMVERVAKAMCTGNWDAKNFNETDNGDEPEDQRDYWRGKARAAIEAMREPDDAMRLASKRYKRKAKVYSGPQCYREMIVAALSKPNQPIEEK